MTLRGCKNCSGWSGIAFKARVVAFQSDNSFLRLQISSQSSSCQTVGRGVRRSELDRKEDSVRGCAHVMTPASGQSSQLPDVIVLVTVESPVVRPCSARVEAEFHHASSSSTVFVRFLIPRILRCFGLLVPASTSFSLSSCPTSVTLRFLLRGPILSLSRLAWRPRKGLFPLWRALGVEAREVRKPRRRFFSGGLSSSSGPGCAWSVSGNNLIGYTLGIKHGAVLWHKYE
jgi:hypothetical protein